MKKILLILTTTLISASVYGQDIFKDYGIKEPLTLSKGRFVERFPVRETVQIGTVLYNTKTREITEFLEEETTVYAYFAELSTRWLSPDPLAAKFPEHSPYVYCANNPIIYIDPDGRFPMSMHSEMVATAFSSTKLSPRAINNIRMGTSFTADIANSKNAAVHMDGMKDTKSIGGAYVRALYSFGNQMKAENYEMAGVALHTVADFYSHSNYIPLYQQYATDNNLSMDVNDIPTFSEAAENIDFMNFIEDN